MTAASSVERWYSPFVQQEKSFLDSQKLSQLFNEFQSNIIFIITIIITIISFLKIII